MLTAPSTSTSVPTRRPPAWRTATLGSAPTQPRSSTSGSGRTPRVSRPHALPGGAYGPPDLQAAYGTVSASATNGTGRTVAIVDAYDDPNAESDLATYRSAAGLTPCTTENGCFRKVNQNGGTTYPAANAGWAQEISLDVDMVSAMCPRCNILLVEASSNSFLDLGIAVNQAASLGAVAISNSYGGGEFSSESSFGNTYFNHPGVAITASSGDSGYGVEYPAASPNVIAVGGTTLQKSGGTFTETVWNGAGSGCSAYEPKPSWQHDAGCPNRTVADVSAIANPSTGVLAYDSYGVTPGWYIFGGTSVASPIVASIAALAGGPFTNPAASYLYAQPGALHDVVSGSNGNCGTYLCNATAGFDGPTGLGTPNTTAAFVTAPATPDFSVNATPSSVSLTTGGSGSSTIALTGLNGFTGSAALTSAVSPSSGLTATVPATVTAGGSATLGLNAASAGTYTVTVTATSGSLVHTATVTVTVTNQATPDFSVKATPSSVSLTTGGSGSSTIALTGLNGFTGSAALTRSVSPSSGLTTTLPTSVDRGRFGDPRTHRRHRRYLHRHRHRHQRQPRPHGDGHRHGHETGRRLLGGGIAVVHLSVPRVLRQVHGDDHAHERIRRQRRPQRQGPELH